MYEVNYSILEFCTESSQKKLHDSSCRGMYSETFTPNSFRMTTIYQAVLILSEISLMYQTNHLRC